MLFIAVIHQPSAKNVETLTININPFENLQLANSFRRIMFIAASTLNFFPVTF